ncbi:MAG: flagellar biosynthesis protein FlgF, partial [Proteobacteria bacterium]|nr:flagellar biosynthesis protein FlgF [Pseudomonadota bacterium]
GFRKDLATYAGTRSTDGLKNGVDLSPGTVQTTGNKLDVAIDDSSAQGEGYLVIETPDGGEAYSRRGDLRVDLDGFLVNGAGQFVMGEGGRIAVQRYNEIEIAADGTISIQRLGALPNAMQRVDRLMLVRLDEEQTMVKGEDGLLRIEDGSEAIPDASLRVVSGALETSNVNPVDALVEMISLARRFETQVKLMQSSQENQQSLDQILRFS